jgi:hypothetical protein
MKKILVCAAIIAVSSVSGVYAQEIKDDPIMALVAAKEAKAKPVSWCLVQAKKYDCGTKKIVVFRASGEIACRGPSNLAEKGEKFCTSQVVE